MVPTPLTDSQLPPCVSELPCPPRILHLCGLIPTRPMVAIVGTRRPTLDAVLFAEKLAKDLIAYGFAVASGGAAGIDSAAHRGALQARGQTLVVAPSGWYSPYPAINQPLFEQIVAGNGGYLSLVDPYCKPMASHFFARNALMVALSRATVLIQAPVRSGARNAAHVARKLGRQLYVVPSTPWIEQGLGCILELKLGARPLGSIRDLLTGLVEIGVHGNTNPLQLQLPLESACGSVSTRAQDKIRASGDRYLTARFTSTDPNLQPVVNALSNGCHTVDSVCAFTGWKPPKVHGALLRLTLDGQIRVTSAGRIEIITL